MRWVALLLLVLACKRDDAAPPTPSPPAVAAPPRMFSDDEIAALQADLITRVEANRKRSCPGPRLLAPAVPGRSAQDIAAILEPSSTLAPCMDRLAKAGDDLKAAFAAKQPEAVALDDTCGALLAVAVHAASEYEGGCSPYQVGLHAEPGPMLVVIRLAHLLGFHASNVKDPMAALGLLLDGLRFVQDLERGHVPQITAMIAIAGSEILATRADAILDTAQLSTAQLDALAGALDRLIAGAPSIHDVLQGERDEMALHFSVQLFDKTAWAPPGGWPTDVVATPDVVGDPRDQAAAVVVGMMQAADARDRACPDHATFEACRVALTALSTAAPTATPQLDAAALAKLGLVDPEAMRKTMRKQLVDAFAAMAQSNLGHAADKLIGALTHLAELRIHVEALRTHKCPPSYAVPPALSQSLELQADKGTVTVATWSFRCR